MALAGLDTDGLEASPPLPEGARDRGVRRPGVRGGGRRQVSATSRGPPPARTGPPGRCRPRSRAARDHRERPASSRRGRRPAAPGRRGRRPRPRTRPRRCATCWALFCIAACGCVLARPCARPRANGRSSAAASRSANAGTRSGTCRSTARTSPTSAPGPVATARGSARRRRHQLVGELRVLGAAAGRHQPSPAAVASAASARPARTPHLLGDPALRLRSESRTATAAAARRSRSTRAGARARPPPPPAAAPRPAASPCSSHAPPARLGARGRRAARRRNSIRQPVVRARTSSHRAPARRRRTCGDALDALLVVGPRRRTCARHLPPCALDRALDLEHLQHRLEARRGATFTAAIELALSDIGPPAPPRATTIASACSRGGNAVRDEVVLDVAVLAAAQQHRRRVRRARGRRGRPAGSRRSASRATGSGSRSRGRACRSPCPSAEVATSTFTSFASSASSSSRRTLVGVGLAAVGLGVDALACAGTRRPACVSAIVSSRRCRSPRAPGSTCGEPRQPLGLAEARRRTDSARLSRSSGPRQRRAASAPSCVGDVVDHAVVRGRGGAQHRARRRAAARARGRCAGSRAGSRGPSR